MAAATPPSPLDWTWPAPAPSLTPRRSSSPPLELQLLPPPPFTPSESPWGLDPSRLQQLMMGSIVSAAAPVSNASAACSSTRDLGALFDDNGDGKPLPSGWERCLDLQSGKMFLKKRDTVVKGLQNPCSSSLKQGKDWRQSGVETSRWQEDVSKVDNERQDWSCRWQGEMTWTSQHEALHARKSFVSASIRLGGDTDTPSSPDRELSALDLDLRLTNEKRSKVSFEAQDVMSLRPSNSSGSGPTSTQSGVQESIQPRQWQECARGSEKPANIQEMARESTMVTAVCSKCLIYVLLRKSNPICPRCSVPIILDGTFASPVSKKRPRLELSPDVLSLSTDSLK